MTRAIVREVCHWSVTVVVGRGGHVDVLVRQDEPALAAASVHHW